MFFKYNTQYYYSNYQENVLKVRIYQTVSFHNEVSNFIEIENACFMVLDSFIAAKIIPIIPPKMKCQLKY
jgi:hypothetical protein